MNFKATLSVVFALLLAFCLGYKRDAFDGAVKRLRTGLAKPEVRKEAKPEDEKPPPAAGTGSGNTGPVIIPPPIADSGPYGRNAAGSPQPSPGANLETALDAVRPAELSDEMRNQRNVYFDRLQQQLQEMRQQNPQAEQPPIEPPTVSGLEPPNPAFNQQTVPGAVPPPPNANAYPLLPPPGGREPDIRPEMDEPEEPDEPDDDAAIDDAPDASVDAPEDDEDG